MWTKLTWEDIRLIERILDRMIDDDIDGKLPENMNEEEYYTEVLNRFEAAAKSTVYVPSCWRESDMKKSPSKCSWARIDDDGNYECGETYYDADLNEITKEEYEALLGQTPD